MRSPRQSASSHPQDSQSAAPAQKVEEVTINPEPNHAAEFKAEMGKGATGNFRRSADGTKLNSDTHGDAPGIKHHGYGKDSGAVSEWRLTPRPTAPTAGSGAIAADCP